MTAAALPATPLTNGAMKAAMQIAWDAGMAQKAANYTAYLRTVQNIAAVIESELQIRELVEDLRTLDKIATAKKRSALSDMAERGKIALRRLLAN